MGHIMYYLLYKDQPLLYRTGANPGFHEAIGDTIALSVSTPQHLQTVGLLTDYEDSEADNINALFHMALERVAFLPFGLLIDKWRWDVFSETTPEAEWNKHWWELREQYQKVKAPSDRTEEFFDPGAKYHIPADSQYIAYFVAHILEFSFYRSLCIEAEQYNPADPSAKPLHKCDFYRNEKAGNKLRAGLESGYSQRWNEALETLTGESEISAKALMEYFAPLQAFLKKQNDMSDVLDKYEEEASVQCNKMVKAEWAVATDTESEAKQEALAAAVLEYANFSRTTYDVNFKDVKPADYTNELVQRQLKYLVHLGRDALDESSLNNVMTMGSVVIASNHLSL
jgi:peptidyl-dipeptidase A